MIWGVKEMSQISIMKANSKSLVGAKLNQMALGSAANTLAESEKNLKKNIIIS